MAATQADDERHRVAGDDLPFSGHPHGPGLADWLDWLADGRATGVRAVLPAAGDALGIPGGPGVAAEVLEHGEGVVTLPRDPGEPCWVLAGEITAFGSELEPGVRVTWHQHRVDAARAVTPAALIGAAEAEASLRTSLATLTEQLLDLDVARWRDAALDLHPGYARGLRPDRLPQGTPARVIRILDQAVRVRRILALAAQDDGAAVNAWQADARGRLLRELDTVARQAIVAVTIPPGFG